MTRRRYLFAAGLLLAFSINSFPFVFGARVATPRLPSRLSDDQFWSMVSDFSEPDGHFRSENLMSNESLLQTVIPALTSTIRPGGVYMGVGPEQNFTYIAALRPAIAFIVDVRRGNLDLHLMYKALFELSSDRVDFVSRLFSKKKPGNVGPRSTVAELFAAYSMTESSDQLFAENLNAIRNQLVKTHHFGLSEADDLQWVEHVYRVFFSFGSEMRYSSSGGFGGSYQPTYVDLMVTTDGNGEARGYLSSDESFQFLKDLESRNMLVPVVGNFAGPKALRAVGEYLKDKDATVSAFYLSNVEMYLRQDSLWKDFCGNVAALPLDEHSTFIRAVRGGGYSYGMGLHPELAPMAASVKDCG